MFNFMDNYSFIPVSVCVGGGAGHCFPWENIMLLRQPVGGGGGVKRQYEYMYSQNKIVSELTINGIQQSSTRPIYQVYLQIRHSMSTVNVGKKHNIL